jgi:amino acid adenylation domain-containing protein
MALLAAWRILLYRYSGEEDIAIGVPIASRRREETEGLIGFMVNTVVMRSEARGGDRVEEVMRRERDVALEAYGRQDVPFEKLVEELAPERSLTHTPLFQVFFNYINFRDMNLEFAGLTCEQLAINSGKTKFDLTLYIIERDGDLTATINYNVDLFDAATITRMLAHFQTLLEGIIADPKQSVSKAPLLTEAERRPGAGFASLVKLDGAFTPFDEKETEPTLVARFQKQVEKHPLRVAVKSGNHEWSYNELDRQSNRIANSLLSRRGGSRSVALLFDHGAPMIAALLGALKARMTFIPLDASYPEERLAYIAENSDAGMILSDDANLGLARRLARGRVDVICLREIQGEPDFPSDATPSDIAYILYTSGSTGLPKGVAQNHRNVLHYIKEYTNHLRISAHDRLTLFSSYGHDAAVVDIFAALLNGAALHVRDLRKEGLLNLGQWLRDESVTIFHSTPTLYRSFVDELDAEDQFHDLRCVVLGGEEVFHRDVERYKSHFGPDCICVNLYGSTESSISLLNVIGKEIQLSRNEVPAGHGIDDAEVLLLDEAGEQTEFYGELAIRSSHLALGYWRMPEATKAVFLNDPRGGGKRIYKTGDYARVTSDGAIEILGRKDNRVKIRGFRVEMGEIETVLTSFPDIQEALVIAREDTVGDKRLFAYVVARPEKSPRERDMRAWVSRRLPSYMIPEAFIKMDSIPRAPNGKVDRAALPAPDRSGTDDASYAAPRTTTEELVSSIWSQALGVERVGAQDNFFELGGHSLLAMRVISQVCGTLRVDATLRDIFTHPTVEEFARRVDDLRSGSPQQESLITPISRDQELPFSFNEGWFLFSHWIAKIMLNERKFPFYILVGLELRGPLNTQALEDALNEIIRRHEIMRTSYSIAGDGSSHTVSRVLQMGPREIGTTLFKRSISSEARLSIVLKDIEKLSSAEADTLIRWERRRYFDYEDPPMLRALLFKTQDRKYHLTLLLHHIASDGFSIRVLLKELAALYGAFSRGAPSPLDELTFQYVDFADWQHRKLQGAFLMKGAAYWEKQQSEVNLFDIRELPFPRPDLRTTDGGHETVTIDQGLSQRIRSFVREKRLTLSMFLLSGLDILLHLYTGKERIGVWSNFANRTRPGLEGLMGWFSHRHIVAMKLLSSQSANEVFDHARDCIIDATEYSEIPFILVQMLRNGQAWRDSYVKNMNAALALGQHRQSHEKGAERVPHIVFDLEPERLNISPFGGLVMEPVYLPPPEADIDLRIVSKERGTQLVLGAIYAKRLFFAPDIREMLMDFKRVLEKLLESPEAPVSSFANVIRAP